MQQQMSGLLRVVHIKQKSLQRVTFQIKRFYQNLTGFQAQQKTLKASGELSGSRWALFVESISVNGSTCFVSVTEFNFDKRIQNM